jgi:hypothetical protein
MKWEIYTRCDLGIDGRMMLKLILEVQVVKMWTGFSGLKVGFCDNSDEHYLDSLKKRDHSEDPGVGGSIIL